MDKGSLYAYMVSKKTVVTKDLTQLEKLMKILRSQGQKAKQSLFIGFEGYDHLVEEVYEIPEIREWAKAVFKRFPYIFYYTLSMRPIGDTTGMLAKCLGDVTAIKPAHMRISTEQIWEQAWKNGELYQFF